MALTRRLTPTKRTGSLIIGVFAAAIPCLAVSLLKPALSYDDALDTFGGHAVGGTLGALLTGLLATKEVNSNLKDEFLASLFKSPVLAVIVTLLLSTIATAVIAYALRGIVGLRVSTDIERAGLDVSEHGEEAYID